jgi:hypothetical protein
VQGREATPQGLKADVFSICRVISDPPRIFGAERQGAAPTALAIPALTGWADVGFRPPGLLGVTHSEERSLWFAASATKFLP